MIRFQRGRGRLLSVWLAGHGIRVNGVALSRAVAHTSQEERMRVNPRQGEVREALAGEARRGHGEGNDQPPEAGAGRNHMSVDAPDAKGRTP
jgi:hypothetical protein